MANRKLGVEVELALSTAVLRPGDRLVVAIPRPLTDQEVAEMHDRIKVALPGVGLVVIDQCSGLATYRPDATED